jgi:cell fate regulator YaaT (PSP1 superfamily)
MKYIIRARYGVMAYAGEFVSRSSEYERGERLILKTNRGTEMGQFITVKSELPPDSEVETEGKVIGIASEDEKRRMEKIRSTTQIDEMRHARERIRERKLPMKLTYTEHILGGERIIFYFTADERIDFRELVKDLAEKYKTRIEMKQIGARDEALLVEECGMCGRDLCCRSILHNIEPVSMKMAKAQTSTLDPAKVSGRCGRLKCCFRYEHDLYKELGDNMPDIGDRIKTRNQEGEVMDVQVLAQKVIIAGEDDEHIEVPMKEIIEVIKK